MDYYKSESEFIDSLDFLSPPVKRVVNSRELFGYSYNGEPNSVPLFRGFCNKFASKERAIEYKQEKARHRKARRIVKTGGESSTSLVLKKTSERKILKRYTVLSYTSLHSCNKAASGRTSSCFESKSKPLIKVTVIPKTEKIKTAKLLRKRRNIPKRVQSTPSNHENSVKTKNLYVVVAGRRNKIYEIKTTGSATFSSDQTDSYIYSKDDISIEGLSNVKHLIQSLDMDNKQKKVKKEHNIDSIEKADLGNKHQDPYQYEYKSIDSHETEGYAYSGNLESGKRPSNRSRVRIYGQLGITGDDRYVLRYGATVNDKLVTDFAQLTQDFLPQVLPESEYSPYEANPEVTKEASVQAAHGSYYRNQQPTVSGFEFRTESQGTQVNFNVSALSRNQYKNPRVNKDVQCTCSNIVEHSTTENKCEINPLKESHSPLVIISVYPKQSPAEIIKYTSDNHKEPHKDARAQNVMKLKADESTNKKTMESKVDESKEKKMIPSKKYNKRSPSNRSPSPVKNNISKRISPENKKETILLKTQTNTSPDRYKAMRVIKNKIIEKEKVKPEATSKFGVPISKPVQRSKSPLKKNFPIRSQEKGTNTDHARAKKDLVDNYTKQLTSQMSHRDKIPTRRNNSKVMINIEGEQEYYNVLLNQSKLSTDLRVNRRIKNIDPQKCSKRNMSPSLENLLLLPDKQPDVQPVSVPFCDKQFDASSMNNKRVSGMTIRDSLEISHRREDKQLFDMPNTQNYAPAHSFKDLKNNSEFLAPIKHYTGDACSICNPVERDKQIRELLGVNKSKCFAPTSLQAHSSENDEYPLHCFYRKECEKRQLAEINLVKYCPILGSISKLTRRTGYHRTRYSNAVCNVEKICGNDDENAVKKSVHGNNQGLTGNTENSALYQQLILNRNIQVFLQVEQFSKQRPIILSRKQYDKVKKTIQTTLSNKNKEKRKKYGDRFSDATVGYERQRRNNDVKIQCNQQIQTELMGFQRTNKRPRMISKVRYLVRTSSSKLIRDRFLENDINSYGNLCEYYQDYPQKITKADVEPHQRTFQATILYPRNYEYYRPSAEYCEVKRQKQYEHPVGYRRNVKCVRSNDQREIHRNYENFIPNVMTQQNNCNKCDKYHILNENVRLETKEHSKQYIQCRKERKEHSNPNEKNCFEIGYHRRFIDKCDKECGEHRKLAEERLKQKVERPRYNKEYCKKSREYCTVITKYCIDCGKRYKPNKECCKETKAKPNDITFRDTKRYIPREECNKKNKEYIKSVKKCCKESGEHYTTGLLRVSASDHPTIESKEHVITSRTHHIACGEYNIKSEGSQLISLQRPPRGEYQEDLPHDIGVNHSFHGHQNTETHKVNEMVEVHPAKKWEYYTPTYEPEGVVLEHTKPFEERNKPHFESASPIEEPEKSLRERLKYNGMLDKNLRVSASRFEEEKCEERSSRVSEQEPHEVYSDQSRRYPDYFKHGPKTEEYFGQSVEYCRLDIEHHRHIAEHKSSEIYNTETKERSGHIERYDKQAENKEQIRTVTLYDALNKQDNLEIDHADRSTKKTVSSLDIHYTSVSYLKKFDSANSDVAVHSDSSLCHVNSIQTIFRGHRKSPTPNLGTSMYSLYSEDGMNSNKSAKFIMTPRDVKPNKRPFLRRLMSCLVMRSTKPSVLKLPITPAQEMPSVNSSVDSYHISTSLGAVEVSSSIYDTSASFYSNHTILPINSKIKRGFFNSVRGFLTNRRS